MTHARFVDHTAILLSISLRRQYHLLPPRQWLKHGAPGCVRRI
jgi:hypothetical protein